MKLALIGGGGVRSPLFVLTLLRRAERIGIDELCLMDIDAHKLELFGALCRELVRRGGSPFHLSTTTDPRQAMQGTKHVVTTIRVGFDRGRALDERIALNHGVLGQETTGPGGFAMALRSIPALLGYAQLLQEVSPQAWMFNFTNPAGLVTQALTDAGFNHVVGICDGANAGQGCAAAWLNVPYHDLRAEVFGLNHLSWTRRILQRDPSGKLVDVLPGLLADPGFVRSMQAYFEPELVAQTGMFMMEYLYYYHYAEQAVAAISAEPKTRGEEIVELNDRLLQKLDSLDVDGHPDLGLKAFFAYEHRRGATYMHYARPDAPSLEEADRHAEEEVEVTGEAGEGYAGVALDIIEALETGKPTFMGLNVPNDGAITDMAYGDVVEVSCRVDRHGVQTMPIGDVPAPQLNLMRSIKFYEKLTVEAIRTRSRKLAIEALMAHPLVLSYSRARGLVDDYLAAHHEYVGEWS
jgi:6-phospho-beta-glucosidase